MSLVVSIGDKKEFLKLDTTNSSPSELTLTSETYSYRLRYPLEVDDSFSDKNFEIHLFNVQDLTEDDIAQVFLCSIDRRIGWIVSAQSIFSNNHSFAENIHFRRYAFAALCEIISTSKFALELPEEFINAPILDDLEWFLGENVAILIVSLETVDPTFRISDYLPALFTYGFINYNRDRTTFFPKCFPSNRRLNIAKIDDRYSSLEFISDSITKTLPYSETSLLGFFHAYQLIEFALQKNSQSRFEDWFDSAARRERSRHSLHQLVHDARELLSEKSQICEMCNNLTGDIQRELLNETVASCRTILVKLNINQGTTNGEVIYAMRNLIFHSYHQVSAVAGFDDLLDALAISLGRFSVSILSEAY